MVEDLLYFNQIFEQTCDKCNGHKIISQKKELELEIKPGMKDKEQIVFVGDAQQQLGQTPGDLHVILKQNRHRFFYLRKGNDLYAEIPLNFKQAILGFKKSFRNFDNKEVRFSKKKVTQPNEMKPIKGQGMPFFDENHKRGDLHLVFKVSLPESLTEEEKILIESLL